MKQQKSHTTKREKAPPIKGMREGIFNLLMVEAVESAHMGCRVGGRMGGSFDSRRYPKD